MVSIRQAVKITGFIFSLLFIAGCKSPEEAKVDQLFSAYNGAVPGASIMVIKDGKPVFIKSYGLADLEKNVPVQSQTNFRLASVTKQFTAMCIMMLAEQGKLTFEQTLTDIFPDFPEYGKKITVRNILNHTSGLIAYEDLVPDTVTVQVL
ncbi:MAG TPA: class A beta-lactamase-related serine hydrolase, partial [Bacteroidetes bacterium]|nr:class A beta-lactamase-related serine hydrolase [Bacteroidota bacterium]